jgi:hypothetical protein
MYDCLQARIDLCFYLKKQQNIVESKFGECELSHSLQSALNQSLKYSITQEVIDNLKANALDGEYGQNPKGSNPGRELHQTPKEKSQHQKKNILLDSLKRGTLEPR